MELSLTQVEFSLSYIPPATLPVPRFGAGGRHPATRQGLPLTRAEGMLPYQFRRFSLLPVPEFLAVGRPDRSIPVVLVKGGVFFLDFSGLFHYPLFHALRMRLKGGYYVQTYPG